LVAPNGKVARVAVFLAILAGSLAAGSSPARAGLGTDLALGGCGAVTDDMVSTQVAVDPHHLDFSALQGGESPPSQAIAVQCFEPDGFGDCGGSVSVNQPWLQTDRTSFYGVDRVEVFADPAGLDPGTYEGKIHVQYDFIAIDDEEDVNVEMVVEPSSGSSEAL
jgi:hypothetical protein